MECFNHGGEAACGICRQCGKALCHECAQVSEGGLICAGKCAFPEYEEDASVDEQEQDIATEWSPPPWWRRISTFSYVRLLLGLCLFGFAPYAYAEFEGLYLPTFFVVFGAIFFLEGLLSVVKDVKRYG